jgi:hypothetical protein
MVTGRKKAVDHPDVRRVRSASSAAFLIALAVSAAAVAGIRSLDLQAFTLQHHESTAREGGEASEGANTAGKGEPSENGGKKDRD